MQDLLEIKVTGWKQRAAVGTAALIALLLGSLAASMQFGNLLAEIRSPVDPRSQDVSRLALRLAPSDPRAHHLAALTGDDQDSIVQELEKTVRISPADFRWRVALGRAYDQAEQTVAAERQFKTAVDLAPNYAYPRWNLGNFYLRQGRDSEAFEELRSATVGHFTFREQVFSLAWDYFDGDPEQVARVAADDTETQAYLAHFFGQRGEGAAVLRIWDQLDLDAKEKYRAVGSLILQDLYGKGSYPEAQEMARQLGDSNAIPETVSNASFEDPIIDGPKARFGWEILPGDNRVDVALDNQNKLSGARSLKLAFRGQSKTEYANVYQAIVVQPQTDYTLTFYFRTEALRSPVRPLVQIVSANDNAILGSTEMFPPDSKEWRPITLSFRTGPKTNAISIRTFRSMCGEQCSVTGTVWYDDFKLSRNPGHGH